MELFSCFLRGFFWSSSWVFPNRDKWPSILACWVFSASVFPLISCWGHFTGLVGILVWNCNGQRQWLKSGKNNNNKKNPKPNWACCWVMDGKIMAVIQQIPWCRSLKAWRNFRFGKGANPSCFHIGKDGIGQLTSPDLLFTITLKTLQRFWGGIRSCIALEWFMFYKPPGSVPEIIKLPQLLGFPF